MNWDDRVEPRKSSPSDVRNAADVDYGRVVHSASFRRLQGKTQILNLGDSDFYRTRLTHSMEVAQIANGIARQLEGSFKDHPAASHLPQRNLIHALGCAHDLGHPPFGHGGEVALNFCMQQNGGFEGNGQTLRIVSKLENYSRNAGLNLSRRTLLGVLKYPVQYSRAVNADVLPETNVTLSGKTLIVNSKKSKPPKCYLDTEQETVDWMVSGLPKSDIDEFMRAETQAGRHSKPIHKSLDCSIMDTADDIAYGIHDLEDAIALGLITQQDFREHVAVERMKDFLTSFAGSPNTYDGFLTELFGGHYERKHSIGRLVGYFILACEFDVRSDFETPLLKYRTRISVLSRPLLDALQNLVVVKVIKSANVQQLEFKGQTMVVDVFGALLSDPDRLLPADARKRLGQNDSKERVICDYVAGMTDDYLLKTYERLFSPRTGSIFDKL
jgi:dGTPase